MLDPESAGTSVDFFGAGRGPLSVVLNSTTSPADSPLESFPATLALHSPVHIAHTYFLATPPTHTPLHAAPHSLPEKREDP